MPRKPRFAPAGYFNHITQRGNYRQQTFFSAADHQHFLDLLARHAAARNIDILGYCLMPNHYHLIARGNDDTAISRLMQSVNGQYAQYLHGRLVRRGRLWQERFYSSSVGYPVLPTILRYVELNPVRANIVDNPALYPWSSARVHTAYVTHHWLDLATFQQRFTAAEWRAELATRLERTLTAEIRMATQANKPFNIIPQ
ncbi:MAG: transposase [Acidobacteria bacterium]|nr:transposase [Acidobacteriota bacterium]